MKFPALCAMMAALAWGAKAMSSNTRGVRGQDHAQMLRGFHRHRESVPAHDVGPMLKSAEAMLMDLASRDGGTPLADLVAQIRPFVLDMQGSIQTAHNSAQQILTNFASDFSGCDAARTTGESEAATLENTVTGHSNSHRTCRTAEKAAHDLHTTCESDLSDLQEAKESSCQLLADAARNPGCDAIPPTPGETWKSYVVRAATWFRSEANSYVQKEDVCKNDTQKVEDKETLCRGSGGSGGGSGGQQGDYEAKKEECDNTQNELESATCTYVQKVDETCESFANCKNTVADGYEAQLAGIQSLEHQRKVEWNATERLLCLLGAYGDDGSVDASKLQTCQLIGDNTSHLNLVYPTDSARPGACPDLLPHPCEADYLAQAYGGLDAPAKDCTPCASAGGGGSSGRGPALHPGTCTCDMTIDNYMHFVYIDGVDKTADVQGNLKSFGQKKTISFECTTATLLAVQGADAESGCNNGGFAAKCTSTDASSPWNNLVADTDWKVYGADCDPMPCNSNSDAVAGAPSGWYEPNFDDSSWGDAIHGNTNHAQGPVGTPHDICSPDGRAWLFRSPYLNPAPAPGPPAPGPGTLPHQVAYDFEDGTLQGWEILPTCATSDPSYGNTPQERGSTYIRDNGGFSGDYMIRSQNPGYGNDWTKGILESPTFVLCSTTTIRYLLGGGSHCNTAIDPNNIDCNSNIVSFNLEILQGNVWTFKEKDCGSGTQLSERSWTVTGEGGKSARIRAYDLNAGGWGHNLLDNVRIECTAGPP